MAILSGALRMLPARTEAQRAMTWENTDAERQRRLLELHPGGLSQIRWLFAQARSFADSYEDLAAPPEQLKDILSHLRT